MAKEATRARKGRCEPVKRGALMDEPSWLSPQASAIIGLRRGLRTRPSARAWLRPSLALLPALALLAVGPSIEAASAAICPIVLGEVYASGAAASCTISGRLVLTGVTTANYAEVTGNGVHILVPLLAAVSSASGSAVTLGPSSFLPSYHRPGGGNGPHRPARQRSGDRNNRKRH